MTSSDSESEQLFNDRRKMSGVFEVNKIVT